MGVREEIELLDSKIARLKVEYEQYFMRILKREPVQLRAEVERIILNYSSKNISNTSVKFKLNALVAKYNTYKQYWTRTLRAIEDGTYARRSEGRAALSGMSSRPQAPEPAPSRPAAASAGAGPGAFDDESLKDVYEQYIEARKQCKETVSGVSYEKLAKTVEKQIKTVESKYKTKDVDLKVYIKDGKARLAITPKKK